MSRGPDTARRTRSDAPGPFAGDGLRQGGNGREGESFSWVVEDPRLFEQLPALSAIEMADAYLSGRIDILGDAEAAYLYVRNLLRASAVSPPLQALSTAPRLAEAGAAREVNYHYDLPIEFWRPWLGASMLYTCAFFEKPDGDLTEAQYRKAERICRKLNLEASDHLLEIGCGWGAISIEAARLYGTRVTGITLSTEQAAFAREVARQARVGERCTFAVHDYREFGGSKYDKIAAAGVSEHLGNDFETYLRTVFELLEPGGLFLNQGIVCSPQAPFTVESDFVQQLIFPGAYLRPLAPFLLCAEAAGFEIVDVESMSPHYVLTLRHWLRAFEANAPLLRDLVGDRRYREFRIYLAGFAGEFNFDGLRVYQSLLRRPGPRPRDTARLQRI